MTTACATVCWLRRCPRKGTITLGDHYIQVIYTICSKQLQHGTASHRRTLWPAQQVLTFSRGCPKAVLFTPPYPTNPTSTKTSNTHNWNKFMQACSCCQPTGTVLDAHHPTPLRDLHDACHWSLCESSTVQVVCATWQLNNCELTAEHNTLLEATSVVVDRTI